MSDKAIATCAFVTLGSTFGASVAPKEYCGNGKVPDFKLLIGTSLTFLSLSIMDNFSPKIATLLSASLALTAFSYWAVPVMICVAEPSSNMCKRCGSDQREGAVGKGADTTTTVVTINEE